MYIPHTRSIWYEGAPELDLGPLEGDASCDVCVIGAGITGLTLAHRLKDAGRRVIVLDMHSVGSGVTSSTSGHLTSVLDRDFATLQRTFGEEGLRQAVQGGQDAIEHIERVCRVEGIDAAFARVPGVRYSERIQDAERMAHEVEIARSCGLDAHFRNDTELPFARSAMVVADQGQLNALWYVRGLARAVNKDGCQVCEDSRVEGVEDGFPCRVHTRRGTITADQVVHASHTPISLQMPMQARIAPYMSYVVGVSLDGPAPTGLWWDTMEPYHYLRSYELPDGRFVLLVGGEDHKTGQETDTLARFTALEDYTRARFPVRDVLWTWCNEVFESADGLPYLGRLGAGRNVYVCTGYAGNGLTFGTLAALGVADLVLGGEGAAIDRLRPQRMHPSGGLGHFVKENANVAWHLVADRLTGDATIADLEPNHGKIVRLEGRQVAVYRDVVGGIHAMTARCPHAGGTVQWNKAECTWDCPLHGSRFSATGELLQGPATRDLTAREAAPAEGEEEPAAEPAK